jgi:hypothetical protein
MSYIYLCFIAISLITSLFFYSDKRHPYLKVFPPFLFITLIAESFGAYLRYTNKNNLYIYNFFTVFEFCFYMFLVSLIISHYKAKLIIRVISFLYVIIAISNILFFQGTKTFHTVTYSLGCLIIVGVCIYYFFELFRLPKAVKLSKDPAFWICSGLLFFYCCGFPLYAFINFWVRFDWMAKSFGDIFTILNIFLYSLFTIAFLCRKTRNYIL